MNIKYFELPIQTITTILLLISIYYTLYYIYELNGVVINVFIIKVKMIAINIIYF
jgi:hypothetical protein